MTANEQAARIANIAREIAAAMDAFPRLNRKQQTNLAIGGDLLVERLHVAWAQFVGDQWKERDEAAAQVASPLRKALNAQMFQPNESVQQPKLLEENDQWSTERWG